MYVLPGPSANGRTRAPIPLEILPVGEFDPVYRVPLDVRSGELPVLPLSITGAVTMAHVPGSDSYLRYDVWVGGAGTENESTANVKSALLPARSQLIACTLA